MKNLLLALAMLNLSFAFSQCTINGAAQIQVGERQNYTAEIAADFSANAYKWIYLDQKVIPQSNLDQSVLAVKGSVPGRSVLTLEIRSSAGTFKCQKDIEVIAPLSVALNVNAPKCNIEIEAFKEVKVSTTSVAFEAVAAENNFTYKWTVHYRNGSKIISNDKVGKFDFSNENVIDQVELSVTDKKCTKKIAKSYNHYFWYFF